jgi:hypothetical protein
VIEIDKQNIKDLKEEDGNLYKIFAMEGLEKGCELEYYYTFKRDASFFGRETIQNLFPVIDARLEICAPDRLVFEMKGYNCAIAPQDTVTGGRRWLSAELKDTRGVDEEKYAAYKANLERIEYKLSHNTAVNRDVRLFTWNELAKRVYAHYSAFTEKELKKADGLVAANKWDKLATEREKIIAVENYCKKNFSTRDDITDDKAENIEWIINNRISSHPGIVRLYGALYKDLGIDFQIVLACDRNENLVDRSFENWTNPNNLLLYFSGTGKFMAPTLAETRYPWIDPYWGGANGLFCKGTTIGNFTTAIAEIRNIPLEDYAQTFYRIDSKVTLNAQADTLMVDMKQSYGGYSAASYRAGFTYGSADNQKTLLKDMVKYGTSSENIISSEMQNSDFESYADNKPFSLHAVVRANELLERAGNKLLIRIGDLIGPQTEMYQEKPRQFPIQIGFPHSLERHIEFDIPAGYTVRNLGDLSIVAVYKDSDTTMGFISTYVQENNIVRIHVMEEYRRIQYPLSEYEDFKKVINASADFNKVVLVLEKSK